MGYFILTITISMILALFGLAKRNYITVNILTLFVVFQNFVLVLISGYINNTMYNMVLLIKEIYVLITIIFYVAIDRKGNKKDYAIIIVIILLILMTFIHGSGSLMSRLSSLRQLYLPMIFFLFGRKVNKKEINYYKSAKFFVSVMFIAVIFSFIEIINPDKVWGRLGISNYLELKGTSRYVFSDKILPGNFYSYDLYPLLPVLRRTGSFLVDPVIYGQLLGAAFIIALFEKGIFVNKSFKRKIVIVTLGIGLAMTVAKGGIIIAAICFVALIKRIWKKNISSKLIEALMIGAAVIYILFIIKNGVGALAHWKGLMEGVTILFKHPFGLGIGGFGNLASYYSTEVSGTGESFIGAVMGQLGFIGVIIFYWFYRYLFKSLSSLEKENMIIIFWLNLSLFLTSFLNNTAISFTSCYIFYVLAGIVATQITNMSLKKEGNTI